MRDYVDDRGRRWDVLVGRESWGALYALFVPAGAAGAEGVHQTLLETSSYEGAQRLLHEADEDTLTDLFRRAEPK